MATINYRKRLIESRIKKTMGFSGGVVIEGAKWVGKSTTASRFANTVVKLQDPIVREKYKTFATISKEKVLEGKKPILFDEWQDVPEIWDFIRIDIDDYNHKGAYLLTGSTRKQNVKTYHTGTGRINSVYMRPMSLYESGESNGLVSLNDLFNHQNNIPSVAISNVSIDDITKLICRGGWPGSLDLEEDLQFELPKHLLKSIIEKDSDEIDGISKDKEKLEKVIRSYARNVSTLASDSTIYKDQSTREIVSVKTFDTYMNALKRLFIVEDVLPWSVNIRSSSRLRKGSKRQFVDPSIAVAALDLSPKKLLNDFETFGFLFESIATRDIRIYAEELEGKVYYYNDSTGLEVDLIVELRDGSWGGIEVKLGSNELDKACSNLQKLSSISSVKPSFLMILTNTQMAYQRPDGVYVVPLGCLKP
ncbi:ATP-binding protein [bacterium]|jgi:predicted AAA+ superfamily ATPase|nr:ATP-binding protein [bacterium]